MKEKTLTAPLLLGMDRYNLEAVVSVIKACVKIRFRVVLKFSGLVPVKQSFVAGNGADFTALFDCHVDLLT